MFFLLDLSPEKKVILFDDFIKRMENINKKCGQVLGTIQVVEMFEDSAVRSGFKKCPHCGQRLIGDEGGDK
jgi:hypothetical protein